MALSRTELQSRSDEKRGVKAKTYKLPLSTIADIEQLSRERGIPQNQLITQAIALLKAQG